jgi:2-polyprenyl-3-methyl-5-hydroxy-6-metoxy-1,4-benzoquinol methylase
MEMSPGRLFFTTRAISMALLKMLKTTTANLLRAPRAKLLKKIILREAGSVLDIGCRNLYFAEQMRALGLNVTPADLEPVSPEILALDIQDTGLQDGAYDVVVALEVLEHVPDPVRAMRELKRIAKRQLIISVPNEPWFSFWRFNTWEEEHFWAIAWPSVHFHLGKPDFEDVVVLGRYRYFVWNLS